MTGFSARSYRFFYFQNHLTPTATTPSAFFLRPPSKPLGFVKGAPSLCHSYFGVRPKIPMGFFLIII